MKKMLCLAVIATAFVGAPAYAKSQGVAVAANVLTGKGGVVGLLDGRGALVVNTSVTTLLPIFTMLGAAGVAATLRTAESWEGPLTDALCGEIGAAAENIRAIVAEAQKKVSLP